MLASGVSVSALAVFQWGEKNDFFIFFDVANGLREEKNHRYLDIQGSLYPTIHLVDVEAESLRGLFVSMVTMLSKSTEDAEQKNRRDWYIGITYKCLRFKAGKDCFLSPLW